MWTIVGLGNPGKKYSKTRHNVGFRVIERLSEAHDIELDERELFVIGRGALKGCRCVLLKPLTFMNNSGRAVKKVKGMNVSDEEFAEKLVVIHDDIDMDTGMIKIRKSGSSGGHRGVESIIRELGTRNFVRIKIGVGREEGVPVDEYVLGKFGPPEKPLIEDAIINAADAVGVILTEGTDVAMNRFNRKPGVDKGRKRKQEEISVEE